MKTSVDSLVRVSDHKLERAREVLLQRQEAVQDCERTILELDALLKRERDFIHRNPQACITFEGFMRHFLQKREAAQQALTEARLLREQARENLQGFFTELKKYEEAQSSERERLLQEEAVREQSAADEVAQTMRQRRVKQLP